MLTTLGDKIEKKATALRPDADIWSTEGTQRRAVRTSQHQQLVLDCKDGVANVVVHSKDRLYAQLVWNLQDKDPQGSNSLAFMPKNRCVPTVKCI